MSSNARIAALMATLIEGDAIDIAAVRAAYGVGVRTCQRDLATIKEALAPRYDLQETQPGIWRLAGVADGKTLALAISHVLLGSRALNPDDTRVALAWLQAQLSAPAAQAVHQQLRLAQASYLPLTEAKPRLELMAQVEAAIAAHRALTFEYRGSTGTDRVVQNYQRRPDGVVRAQPTALFFEEHYFYVAMHTGDTYRLYRLDRIQRVLDTQPGVVLDYSRRFSLQTHRRQTYLLDAGGEVSFTFEYTEYPPTALDRFPQAKVLGYTADGAAVIRAHAQLEGACMWLMSQGAAVKVLNPPALVATMREKLAQAAAQYR